MMMTLPLEQQQEEIHPGRIEKYPAQPVCWAAEQGRLHRRPADHCRRWQDIWRRPHYPDQEAAAAAGQLQQPKDDWALEPIPEQEPASRRAPDKRRIKNSHSKRSESQNTNLRQQVEKARCQAHLQSLHTILRFVRQASWRIYKDTINGQLTTGFKEIRVDILSFPFPSRPQEDI